MATPGRGEGAPPASGHWAPPLGASAPASAGRREIFPLPYPPYGKYDAEFTEYVREAVVARNFLAGYANSDIPQAGSAEEVHREVLARVEGLVRRAQRARADTPPPGFLQEFLRGRAEYDLDLAGVTLAPFRTDHVSLPEDLSGAPGIADLFSAPDPALLEVAEEPLLRSTEDAAAHLELAPARPYMDPVLSRQRRHYVQFIRRLDRLGMIRWRRSRVESIGLFFVDKKTECRGA